VDELRAAHQQRRALFTFGLIMRDLLFRAGVPARVEEEHMFVERPGFELINPWLVDELGSVDLHDSQDAFFDNWLAVH